MNNLMILVLISTIVWLTTALNAQMEHTPPHTPLPDTYILAMKERTTTTLSLIRSTAYKTRDTLQQAVMTSVQNFTRQTQRRVISILTDYQSLLSDKTDHLFSFHPLWISNAIILHHPTPELLTHLTSFEEVGQLIKDYKFTVNPIIPEPNFSTHMDRAFHSWGVAATYTDQAWSMSNGSGMRVGVFDTGCIKHEYYAPQLKGFWDMVDPSNKDYADGHGHGTHCVGIVAQMAPGASLYPCKILADDGNGNMATILKGWQTMYPNVDILSCSFGAPNACDSVTQDAINTCSAAGKIMVVASGNTVTTTMSPTSSCGARSSPATCNNAWSVGAINEQMKRASYSNAAMPKLLDNSPTTDDNYPFCGMPGDKIESTSKDGGWVSMSGTSMACPTMAGALAVIMGVNKDKLGEGELREIVKSCSTPVTDTTCPGLPLIPSTTKTCGFGWLNVANGVSMVKQYLRDQQRVKQKD